MDQFQNNIDRNNLIIMLLVLCSSAILLQSCTDKEKELQKVIEIYEQQITDDMDLDLEMKFEYATIMDTSTYKDSMTYYINQYCELFNHDLDYNTKCADLGIEVLKYEDTLSFKMNTFIKNNLSNKPIYP